MTKKVLIVEDNQDIAELVAINLQDLPCDTRISADGRQGLELAIHGQFDLIILDLMLPGLSGLELCRQLRRQKIHTPVLMLTSRSSEADRVLGLEIGADDYLSKPFSILELMARVKALFRRVEVLSSKPAADQPLCCHDIILEPQRHRVTIQDKTIPLTTREFDLLRFFMESPGQVFSRTQLLDQVWGYSYAGYEHTVNSHINRLRNKIERDPSAPEYLLTVWGVGYKFREATVHNRAASL